MTSCVKWIQVCDVDVNLTWQGKLVMLVHFFKRLVEVLWNLDVLKHPGQFVDIVSWHSHLLVRSITRFILLKTVILLELSHANTHMQTHTHAVPTLSHSTMFSSISLSAEMSRMRRRVRWALWYRMNTSLFWTYLSTNNWKKKIKIQGSV